MGGDRIDVSVLTTAHDVADARLHRLVMVLVRAGLTVEVLGLGRASAGPSDALVRVLPRVGLARRAARGLVAPWWARGQVVLVLDPELVAPALLRRLVARRSGTDSAGRWLIADIHEDYLRAMSDRSWARGPRRLLGVAVATSALFASRQADITVAADHHVPPLSAPRRLVLPNLPLAEMLPHPSPRGSRPRAIYIGDVRRSRGLQLMLAALELSPDWNLDVVGPVASQDHAWLRAWQARSPARSRVRFHGRQAPRAAWAVADGAWVGLSLLAPTPAFMAAMPSKVLEYLTCGLAVVSTPLPRPAQLIRQRGTGAVCGDVSQTASVLRRWSDDPAELDRHRAAARAWASEQARHPVEYDEFTRRVRGLIEEDQ